ncbi:MAG TPA: NTP transferase domain-containing protein [Xanthomonadaceae bacterium]|jgi:molybdopterin-guanine dinucleotide biosynthesis protein A|nr:NTP transferase domain-containing protein [Xanthomonadaceae bacterium]
MNTFNALARITLGILAGGRATRLEGRDKAWTVYRGQALIERSIDALGEGFAATLVSANRDRPRYDLLGIRAIADRMPGFPGPLAGIDALLAACETPLLLTLPVDLREIPHDLVQRLGAAGEGGAVAQDEGGLQPLVALWPVARARDAVAQALARGESAVHRVIETLALPVLRFPGADFGNLNTPEDFHE